MHVLYTAAHGGYSQENVPLGGGGAVCARLTEEWTRTKPFDFELVTPAILGARAPSGRALVAFGERDYARFCGAFERRTTVHVLRAEPASTVVLVNDISEGPDFAALAARGFRIFTIYHVDVVAYVASMYLRGWLKPETTVRWYRRLKRVLPRMTRLIWEKQEASVRHSRGLIVPSAGMRDVLLRCYPECPPGKIHVLPWGTWSTGGDSEGGSATRVDVAELRHEYGVPDNAQVLLTLSRISPEKGQDLLLRALQEWEHRSDYPQKPLWLFVCGDAAYMQGKRYLEHLQLLASRLRRTRVIFPGYVTGARKQAFFALADLYVFPSRHESYGLTLLEALTAGVPAVCLDHEGARSVMRPEFGRIVQQPEPADLRAAMAEVLADDGLRQEMGDAARAFARTQRFSDTAARLAELIQQ
jgi:glycosyltransferase involved in cell wall biosynthesis